METDQQIMGKSISLIIKFRKFPGDQFKFTNY